MSTIDPNVLQQRASSPLTNAWVMASAGSGKTKVLTDRLLRLLLGDDGLSAVAPHQILCLTFTKAAAAEVKARIHERLSRWVTLEDDKLFSELKDLRGKAP